MIIKCKKLISYVTKEKLDYSPWRTLDKEYIVLGIEVDPRNGGARPPSPHHHLLLQVDLDHQAEMIEDVREMKVKAQGLGHLPRRFGRKGRRMAIGVKK